MITHKMTQDIVIVCLSFNLLCKGVLEHIRIVNLGRGGGGGGLFVFSEFN